MTAAEKKALRLTCEQELASRDPFWLIESGYFKIKTKSGNLEPLILNRAQTYINGIVKELWEEDQIIRLWILKARQTGATTYCQALIYAVTSQTPNINAVDIADDDKGSNYIFEMSKLYHKEMPHHLKKDIKKSNEKKLEFEGTNSQILVDTAGNPDAGRKFTFRLAHLSEYCFYKKANDLMIGLSQSVPSIGRTIIIKETTANGFNFGKEEWDEIEAGKSDYIGIFIPWYWDDGYQMKPSPGFIIGDTSLGVISKDEPMLVERMQKDKVGNIKERLAWRRWCIRNNCGKGSDKDRLANFKQEYPSIPIEAFKASGECFFDQDALVEQLHTVKNPIYTGDIVYADFKYAMRPNPEATFRFYELPQHGAQYVVGGDACSGSGADNSALVCRRRDSNRIVATCWGKDDPDEFAYKAFLLGGYYNMATVAIENEKFGFAANQKLKTIYKNVYIQRTVDKENNKTTEKFGWETNAVTRPLMLSQMQEEVRQYAVDLSDERLMKECLVFIVNEHGRAEAQEGCHDDFVIAAAISGAVRRIEKPRSTPDEIKLRAAKRAAAGSGPSKNLGFGFGGK